MSKKANNIKIRSEVLDLMKGRLDILHLSIVLENTLSIFLQRLLGAKEDSYSFGNSSAALSFNQKVHLLIDVGALKRDEKKKFQVFMEIRNQLVHNYYAKDISACLAFIPDSKNYVLKNAGLKPSEYGTATKKQIVDAVTILCGQVYSTSTEIIKVVDDKVVDQVKNVFYKNTFKFFLESLEEVEKDFKLKTEGHLEKQSEFSAEYVSKIVHNFSKALLNLVTDKLAEQSVEIEWSKLGRVSPENLFNAFEVVPEKERNKKTNLKQQRP